MKEIERNCDNCKFKFIPDGSKTCSKCKRSQVIGAPQYGAASDLWEEWKNCANCAFKECHPEEPPCEICICQDDYTLSEWEPEEPHIKDSGNRRTFGTDAVRDICDGKGRCDLMPLDMVSSWMNDVVLCEIASFVQTHRTLYLRSALDAVCGKYYNGQADMMLDLAVHFEEGAKKYGEHNWEKGLPIHSYIDSGVRHYFKVLRGDNDEPHLRACVWNLICAMWTMHHKPELNDLPKREENTND